MSITCLLMQIDEGVTLVKPGQGVLRLTADQLRIGNGFWLEFVRVKEDMVVPVPNWCSIPGQEAAGSKT